MSAEKCKHGIEWSVMCRDCDDDGETQAEHSFAAPPCSVDWRKLAPDVPGWWMVAWQIAGEWVVIIHEREADKPWMTRPEWWYAGPISPPNERRSDAL